MKKLILIITSLVLTILSFSQSVSINTSGNPADASAMLDISSTDKGILIPRMADHTSVNSPAQGVMVFDTTTKTFWFYSGIAWVEVTNGGAGGTLDDAYDFGGAGNGRIINVTDGAVEFNNGGNSAHFINSTDVANFTNGNDVASFVGTGNTVGNITTNGKERALTITNSNTTSYGIYTENSNTGVALYGETTNTSNLYGAIQGVSNYGSTSAGNYPSGVAGYFDGSGTGTGVWGQSQGNGSSAGAGIYGMGTNNNFGILGHADTYPGVYAKTNSNTNQALQVTSGSSSYTNPAFYSVGSLQFDCSANNNAHTMFINNVGGEPSITPISADYGYVGTSSYYWYRVYVDELYYKGATNFKNINIDDDTYQLIINDIDNINPLFFQSDKTTTEIIKNKEYLYKPNLSLGINLDELPDYLLDNSFSMISSSGIATLSLAGVKYNRQEIKELKKTISDFGIVDMKNKEMWVKFNKNFSDQIKSSNIPTVTLTTNSPNAKVYISEQNNKGFKIVIAELSEKLMINWIAMAKIDAYANINLKNKIPPELYKQLVVPENIKQEAIGLHKKPNSQKSLKLLDAQNSIIIPSSKRLK